MAGEAMCYCFPVDSTFARVGVREIISNNALAESREKKQIGIINVLKITTILSKPMFANHERASTLDRSIWYMSLLILPFLHDF